MKEIKILGKEYYILSAEELNKLQKAMQHASVDAMLCKDTLKQMERYMKMYHESAMDSLAKTDSAMQDSWQIVTSYFN
jgi:hypothetical protein